MFCDDCRAVTFHDREAGGFAVDEDSEPFLMLDEDDRPKRLPLGYLVHDVYPNLPRLSASAGRGCELCKLLRDTIQSPDVGGALSRRAGIDGASDTELTLTMQYVWRAMVCSFGLSLLIVNLGINTDKGASEPLVRGPDARGMTGPNSW